MEKTFNTLSGVGKAKYLVTYYTGTDLHADASLCARVMIFENKVKLNNFTKQLSAEGYLER